MTNSYDAVGRLLSSTLLMNGVSRMLSHRYDLAGRRIRLEHPDNAAAYHYDYDAAGRLESLSSGTGTTTTMLASFGYTYRGLVASRDERVGSSAAYTYDRIGG